MKLNEAGQWAIITFIVMVATVGVVGTIRWVTNVSTPVVVTEVEPGVHCALATTSDGVAIDCWQVKP